MEAMCVNNLPKVATQWNSGATRDSNPGRRVLIPSALTTRPPSHTLKASGLILHPRTHTKGKLANYSCNKKLLFKQKLKVVVVERAAAAAV